jgi:hypothetical protein
MKMHGSICGSVLLAGTCILVATGAWAQQVASPRQQSAVSADVAVTFTAERGQLAGVGRNSFWLKGGGADAAVAFWKGLSLAASVNGGHAANAAPGVDVNQIAITGGPRYTFPVWTGNSGITDQRQLQLFAQSLFGGVHAFHGVFPGASGTTSSAGSFVVDAGGGLNLYLSRCLGVRLLEADYVRTSLPNNASSVQNDMRLSFGVTYHIGKR